MENKIACTHCKKESDQLDLIVKLGGILCPYCRTIIYYPFEKGYNDTIDAKSAKESDNRKRSGK